MRGRAQNESDDQKQRELANAIGLHNTKIIAFLKKTMDEREYTPEQTINVDETCLLQGHKYEQKKKRLRQHTLDSFLNAARDQGTSEKLFVNEIATRQDADPELTSVKQDTSLQEFIFMMAFAVLFLRLCMACRILESAQQSTYL
uniref:Uncharacterized protein n=1 Tax=Trichuris muris TaxID=70415 RepID=A0A5S6QH40_TRIMR